MTYAITEASIDKLRSLLIEAFEVAKSLRDSGPVGIRYEACNVIYGMQELDEYVRETANALRQLQEEEAKP